MRGEKRSAAALLAVTRICSEISSPSSSSPNCLPMYTDGRVLCTSSNSIGAIFSVQYVIDGGVLTVWDPPITVSVSAMIVIFILMIAPKSWMAVGLETEKEKEHDSRSFWQR